MPVTTDACIFGALVDQSATNWLDIGTGTGVLTLMLAQKYRDAHFTAIEPDEISFAEAQLNFNHSPWHSRIDLKLSAVQDFETTVKYEGIICNPPFFENQLPSPDARKSGARHTAGLSHQRLIDDVTRLMSESGSAWLMLPEIHRIVFENLAAERELPVFRRIYIRANAESLPHVTVLCIGRRAQMEDTIITTWKSRGEYSQEVSDLLKPYYLKL